MGERGEGEGERGKEDSEARRGEWAGREGVRDELPWPGSKAQGQRWLRGSGGVRRPGEGVRLRQGGLKAVVTFRKKNSTVLGTRITSGVREWAFLKKNKCLWNSMLSRIRGHMQSCGEQREDGTFEENNLFFWRLPVQLILLTLSLSLPSCLSYYLSWTPHSRFHYDLLTPAQCFPIPVADSALGTCSLIKDQVCVLLENKKTAKCDLLSWQQTMPC